jgi:hypothetical protein
MHPKFYCMAGHSNPAASDLFLLVQRYHRWLLPVLCLVTTGCTDPEQRTYEVRGLVRYTDGKLLRDGTVEFEVMDRKNPMTATGDIQPDGTFELGTFEMADGAVAGRHRVVVIADQNDASRHERPWLLPTVKLHPKYRAFDTSGLQYEVKPESNHFVIDVEYAPAEASDSKSPE